MKGQTMPGAAISWETSPGKRGRTRILPDLSQIESVHMALLHNGNVLYYSGFRKPEGEDTETRVWHPKDGKFTAPPVSKDDDLFCAGHAFLPDGRLLSTGGTAEYRGTPGSKLITKIALRLEKYVPLQIKKLILRSQRMDFTGPTFLYLFDPQTEKWTRMEQMDEGRWYPTNTALPDGGILLLSGRDSGVVP